MTHTNFIEVARMVFVKLSKLVLKNGDSAAMRHKKNDLVRTDGYVDHQQDRDLLNVCGACLHICDRPICLLVFENRDGIVFCEGYSSVEDTTVLLLTLRS